MQTTERIRSRTHTQAEVGVDAGAYARQLMAHAKQYADTLTADGSAEYQQQWQIGSNPTPTEDDSGQPALQQVILEKAYGDTKVRGEVHCLCFVSSYFAVCL